MDCGAITYPCMVCNEHMQQTGLYCGPACYDAANYGYHMLSRDIYYVCSTCGTLVEEKGQLICQPCRSEHHVQAMRRIDGYGDDSVTPPAPAPAALEPAPAALERCIRCGIRDVHPGSKYCSIRCRDAPVPVPVQAPAAPVPAPAYRGIDVCVLCYNMQALEGSVVCGGRSCQNTYHVGAEKFHALNILGKTSHNCIKCNAPDVHNVYCPPCHLEDLNSWVTSQQKFYLPC